MNTFRLKVVAAVLVTGVTLACKDIPLLPHWDADWNVPLPSQDIALFGPFPGAVPPNTSANISFPPQKQSLGGSVGSILDQNLSNAALVVVLSKSAAMTVSGNDTVFVAADSLSLTNSAATRIVVPVAFAETATSVTDTVAIATTGVTMLQTVARNNGTLWVQLRGRLSHSAGVLTVTPSDSIHVRLSLLATIAISR